MLLDRNVQYRVAGKWTAALVAIAVAVSACGGSSRSDSHQPPGSAGAEESTGGEATTGGKAGGTANSTGGKAGSAGGTVASTGGGGSSSGGKRNSSGGDAQAGDAPVSSGGSEAGRTGSGGSVESQNGGAAPSTGGAGPGTGGTRPAGGATSSGAAGLGDQQTGGVEQQGTGGKEQTAGAGGGTSEPEVGTVGTECSPPGALQCAATHQRLVVVCGGEGTWEALETCPVGQYCDTQPGETLGSCQDPHPDCADRQPGDRICQGNEVYACGPDTITIDRVKQCDNYCSDGQCVDDEPCPTGTNWVNCSTDCTPTEHTCTTTLLAGGDRDIDCDFYVNTKDWSHTDVIRTPAPADMCACASGRRLLLLRDNVTDVPLRLTVEPPWGFADYNMNNACSPPMVGQCLFEPPTEDPRFFTVVTDDPTAPPAYVHIEIWSGTEEEACP